MEKDIYIKNAYDMLYLAVCAVNRTAPDKDRINSMDLEAVLKVCRKHSLSSLCGFALESAGIKDSPFRNEKMMAIRKIMRLDAERKNIFAAFEEKGIWYMPLKGVFMKEYYPEFGMRIMCDNDILFDSSYREYVVNFMKQRGYKTHFDNNSNDLGFIKEPALNYEMHTSLVAKYHGELWYNYYADVKEKLIKDPDNSYGYHFSPEDFYIFMTLHEYKHFSKSGTGLRSLTDVYVYLKKFESELDRSYISQELDKLGIREFEEESRSLALKVFGSENLPQLNEKEKEMLEFYLTSGTYGNYNMQIKNKKKELFGENADEAGKGKYIIRRIFPPLEHYKKHFPVAYKYKILIPGAWAYRIIRAAVKGRKLISSEMKSLTGSK